MKKILTLSILFILCSCNNSNGEVNNSSSASVTFSSSSEVNSLLSENISSSNNEELISSSCLSLINSSIESSISSELIKQNTITFKDNVISCSNDFEFKLDEENSKNYELKNDNLTLAEKDIGVFAFYVNFEVKSINIFVENYTNQIINAGLYNDYGIPAFYDVEVNNNILSKEYPSYFKSKHIAITSKNEIIITKIELIK